jgi:hypothetical protein
MKKILLLPVLFFGLTMKLTAQVQDFEFVMYFEDSGGYRDSLILGLNSQATLGIDDFLGEENIINQAYQEGLDVRVTDEWIKRYTGTGGTYHTKKQIIDQYYEILTIDVKTDNFPVKAHWDSGLFTSQYLMGSLITSINPGGWWDTGSPSDMYQIILHEQDSVVFTSNASIPFNDNYSYSNGTDTIPVYWIVFGSPGIGVGSTELMESPVKLIPNPSKSRIRLEGIKNEDIQQIRILGIDGVCVKMLTSWDVEEINIDGLENGIYILIIEGKNRTYVKRFIKL